MSTEKFLQELGLPVNADIDTVEELFVKLLRERLHQVAEHYTESELKAEDTRLRLFLKLYFDYSLDWAGREVAKYKDVKEFSSAPELKKKARTVVTELQNYIGEFISCYMHLGRFTTLLRDEIKEEEIKVATNAGQRVKWTPDSGVVIERYRKEKKKLLARMDRMTEARELLETVNDDFDILRDSATNLFGKDKAEPYIRRFTASMRVLNFKKASKTVKEVAEAKKKFGLDQKTAKHNVDRFVTSATRILELVQKEQKTLTSEEGRVCLRPFETELAYNGDIRELQKIKAFLAKYHLPYMQYKLDALNHLKDKLLVLNSLESLMALYKKLLMGIARPLKDIKVARYYESEVLNHIQYLLTGHFTEVPKILQRAEETVEEFRQSRRELEEFEEMDLEEIEVSEQEAAQA